MTNGRLWLLTLIWIAFSQAAADPVRSEHVEVELVAEVTSVKPGEPFWVALRLDPDEHWHTYWRNPGDTGLPTRIDWQLPPGAAAGEILWPYPDRIQIKHLVSYGYEREVFLITRIEPPERWSHDTFSVTAHASWLVCRENCIPGEARLALELPVSPAPPLPDFRWQAAFAETRARIPIPRDAWQGAFKVSGERVGLRIEAGAPAFADAARIVFFPIAQDLINYGAPQRVAWEPAVFELSQRKSEFFQAPPDRMDGVVVVTDSNGERGFAVTARHDPALALVLPAGEPPAIGLLSALVLAALGGLLLNLMPCVFPVLSLKALSLADSAGAGSATRRLHGLSYTLGVVLSFAVVAGMLLLLRAAGDHVGWGFQLQTPWFVGLLAYLLFAMGLSLSGVFELGGRFMDLGDSLTRGQGYPGSFFTGVLAVVVASPCTAPFMASAIGFAVTQPPLDALLIFVALGLGMASPFLAFAFVPALVRLLPRPGPWMERFKQLMAFPLYLSAVWLLWVLGRQSGVNGMAAVLGGMVLLAFALWLWASQSRRRLWSRSLAAVATLAALAILNLPMLSQGSGDGAAVSDRSWEPYSPGRFAELRREGRPVFVNLTADWCITCLVNEQVALSSDPVRQKLADGNVAYLKGDWTNRNPEITEVLAEFGRSGVPLYVFYPAGTDAQPVVLPQILTPAVVLEALERS